MQNPTTATSPSPSPAVSTQWRTKDDQGAIGSESAPLFLHQLAARWRLFRQMFIERVALKKDIDRLYLVGGGPIFFQTLVAATRLDLFTHIENGLTSDDALARHTGTTPKAIRIIMLGLVALKMVRRARDGRYKNTLLTKTLLTSNHPSNVLPILEWQAQINYRAMAQFPAAVTSGRNEGLNEFPTEGTTLYAKLAQLPELERVFQAAMENLSERANAYLIEHGDFHKDRHILDIGGGNGTNLLRIAQRFSQVRGTVFDSRTVCAIAQQHIASQGFSSRIGVYPGDCFQDELPFFVESPVDCILLSHFCTIWNEAQNQELFRKAYQRLPPGGRLLVFNMMQDNDQQGPLSAAMGSPYFLALATGEGMLYTWGEYENWLQAAGFSRIKRQRLPMDHGLLIATK